MNPKPAVQSAVPAETPMRRERGALNFDTGFITRALPNEYLIRVGKKSLQIQLGGEAFRLFRHYLKIPASAETTNFELECSTGNYMGIIVRGYVVWRLNPENAELAIRTLDFYDPHDPMEKTGFLISDMAKDAVRRSIAGLDVREILNSSDILLNSIRVKLEDVHKWGLIIDSIGIDRIYIKSEKIFNDLQANDRNALNLLAEKSRMDTVFQVESQKLELEKQKSVLTSNVAKTQFEEKAKQERMKQEFEIEQARLEASKQLERLAREDEHARTVAKNETERREAAMRAEKAFDLETALAEADNRDKKLAADEAFEARRYGFQKERLGNDLELQTTRVKLDLAALEVKTRQKQVEGLVTDTQLTQSLFEHLKDLAGIFSHAQWNVFSSERQADFLAPLMQAMTAIRGMLSAPAPPADSGQGRAAA